MATPSMVTREQFVIRSELEVIHVPTGTVLQAYPYSNPDDVLASIRMISPPVDADLAENIQLVGRELLLEQTCRAHRLGYVA